MFAPSTARGGALAVAGLLTATGLFAQRPNGSIRGIVYDSLVAGRPLAGATVELIELGRAVSTNGQGVFRFDSLPGGRYTISFSHPMLSEIGFTPPDKVTQVGDGIDIAVVLATPSGESIYRRLCPGVREPATGVLLGTLRRPSGDPIAAGEIRGDWVVSTLTRETGFTSRPRVVRAATDATGRFQLCGVPTDVPVLLKAVASGVEGSPLDLRMADKPFLVRHITLDPTPAAVGSSRLVGKVVTATGGPLAEAQVLLLGGVRVAKTRADGTFLLDSLAPGSHTVEARAIGYGRQRLPVEIPANGEAKVNLLLPKVAVELAELKVAATAGRSGFEERRRRAIGGYFITSDETQRRGTVRAEDVFRTVPGMRVEVVGGTDYRILSLRGGAGLSTACEPTVFVDGIRIPLDPSAGLSLPVTPEEIDGIEVHQSATSAPPEYRPFGENCGVILIWTKRGRR